MTQSPTPVLYLSADAEVVEGGNRRVLNLAARLDRTMWTPLVVVPSHGEMAEQCRQHDIATFIVPMPSASWPTKAMRASLTRIREIIRVTDAAVLHANGAHAMLYAGLAGRLEGRRVVWHLQPSDGGGLYHRLLARLAHRVMVPSQSLAGRVTHLHDTRVLCVHNGVDLELYRPRPSAVADQVRRQLNIPLNAPMVMSLAPLTREHGQLLVLDAAQQLSACLPDLYWVIGGEGEGRQTLEERCAQLGLQERVRFPGWLPDVPGALAACDVFLSLPGADDGVESTVVEAMAMRKPIIACLTDGAQEVVVPGETGVLVPADDVDAFAHAVRTLVSNPNLAAFYAGLGRARVEARFTLTGQVQTVSGLYESLVA